MSRAKPKTTMFFVRGLPVELRDRLTNEAKRRGTTVGHFLTEILSAALSPGKIGTSLDERVARLEKAVAGLVQRRVKSTKPRH